MSTPIDTIYFLICELKVARALISDRVRGTNDRNYDLCKDWDRIIADAEKTLKEMRNQ